MLERININYRDFDEKSFNVYAPVDETSKKTNELFEQALELEPRTNGEKEVYADYLKTLENITAAYLELQNIQHRLSLLATSSENVADVITQLEKIALKPAAIIYSRTQDLFILESTKELNNMIQRAKNKKKTPTEKMETKNIVHSKNKNVYDVLSILILVFSSIFFMIGLISFFVGMDNSFFYLRYSEHFFLNMKDISPDSFWIKIETSAFVSLVVSLIFESCSAIMSLVLAIFNSKKALNVVSFGISMGLLTLVGIIVFCAGI